MTTSVSGDISIMNSISGKELEHQTHGFIKECAFAPVIAVLTSFDVDVIVEKNQLSFCELLLPFSQLSTEAVLKDPNNQNVLIKNLRLDFRDLRRDGFLSNAALSLALAELLRQNQPQAPSEITADGSIPGNDGYLSNGTMDTPWYDSYRYQFLRLLDPPEHEFNRHYLACILVVSTMHEDPLDQFNRLSQAQHALQHQQQNSPSSVQLPKHAAIPKWFSPNTFKYHLLLHDVATGDDRKAESVYQGMKMNYGAHACHLLRINSSPSNALSSMPDPWSRFLRHRLRHFNTLRIQEDENYATKEIISDVEPLSIPSSAVSLNGDGIESGVEGVEEASVIISDGATIPHPLSCTDLPNLEHQPNVVQAEKDERAQIVHHGQYLTSSDIDRIKIFVQEFSIRGLFPYVERQLRLLNEQVAARRGLHKTFMNFTKTLWGKTGAATGSSPNLQSMTTGATSAFSVTSSSASALASPEKGNTAVVNATSTVTYTYESAEMQTRRLADLAALFQNYEFAYQLYHGLKKDFMAAQTWLHSASAMEFASLCVFLSGPTQSRPYPSYYMDQAINAYLTICGTPLLSSRATMYNTAILCSCADYGQAAAQYIRLTSGDDLRSALFLEQAAYCFIKAGLKRKAALHLILAGHRYGKAAKRQHTMRCYQSALKSYDGKGWRYALEHIYMTLGQEVPSTSIQHPLSHKRYQADNSGGSSWEPFFPKAVLLSKGNTDVSRYGKITHEGDGEALQTATSPVTCTLLCQPMIEYDFNSNGLCRMNISLDIHYSAEVEELMVKCYAGGMSSMSDFQHFYHGYPLLLWSSSCRRARVSNSGQTANENGFFLHRFDLTAVITIPGIYDISCLKLSYRKKNSQWEDTAPLQPQFLTVIQSLRKLLPIPR